MIRAFASAFTVLLVTVLGHAQQPQGLNSARAMFSEMVDEQVAGMEVHKLQPDLARERRETQRRREDAIRANPAACVPLIREALTLPKPEELQVPTTPEGRLTDGSEQYQRQSASGKVAAKVLSLLPADVRDPILRESFDKTLALARTVKTCALAEHESWKRAGADKQDRMKVVLAIRKVQWFEGRCIELINAAAAAKSEVLLEPVFAAIADSGSDVGRNQQVGLYLEALTQRREEVLRRLNLLLSEDQPTDRLRKLEIGRWIKRMEAGNS